MGNFLLAVAVSITSLIGFNGTQGFRTVNTVATDSVPGTPQINLTAKNIDGSDNSTLTDGDDIPVWVNAGDLANDFDPTATEPTFDADCDGSGLPCVQLGTSQYFIGDGVNADYDFMGADGTAFQVYMLVKTDSANPNALYGLYGTATSSSGSDGSLFYYDDRAGSGREDKVLFRHYPVASDQINSSDDALPAATWTVISVTYPGSSGGTITLRSNNVSVGTSSAGAYTPDTSASPLRIGSVNGVNGFAGKVYQVLVYDYEEDETAVYDYLVSEWSL